MKLIRFTLACAACAALAQAPTGTIAGVVLDPAGAAVPGARITIVNAEDLRVSQTSRFRERGKLTLPTSMGTATTCAAPADRRRFSWR